jgi:hypothetical protein
MAWYDHSMDSDGRTLQWEALEHTHIEKTNDWYWALGIVALAGSVTSILLGNVLFGIVIILGATTMIMVSHRPPRTVTYELSPRGLRIESTLYPFPTLKSYCIDEDTPTGPQLLIHSNRVFMPLIILSIPEDFIDDIDYFLSERMDTEHIEEPFGHKLLEFFGF